jgi:hypothetical protein
MYVFYNCFESQKALTVRQDPIILSGTPFLVYFTRAASNIQNPNAWIFAQFAAANISSAILVSSNPTNLVLAGAFQIKFITYTANMIVPVLFTAAGLFPFLLFIIFRGENLIPRSIRLLGHEDSNRTVLGDPLSISTPPDTLSASTPTSPTFVTESKQDTGDNSHRDCTATVTPSYPPESMIRTSEAARENARENGRPHETLSTEDPLKPHLETSGAIFGTVLIAFTLVVLLVTNALGVLPGVYTVTVPAAFIMFCRDCLYDWMHKPAAHNVTEEYTFARENRYLPSNKSTEGGPPSVSLCGILQECTRRVSTRFPTVAAVFSHLPFPMLPFAFCMFILVEGLVSQGWVEVFAKWWAAWVKATGPVGAIAGMGFVSVCLCNVSRIFTTAIPMLTR